MESGHRTPGPPESGGLIVMVRPDPATAARALADDLRADLAVGGAAAEAALERLIGRLAAEVEPTRDLDELATAMRRAEAIRERTRAATAVRLAASFNTRLAIHPDTIRRAAAELLDARADALAAEQATERRAANVRHAVRVALAGAGLAGVVVGVAAGPLAGLAVVGAAAIGGAAIQFGRATAARRHRGAAVPELAHQAAIERAQRRWTQVTGEGADPTLVESFIHRYEPQHRLVVDLLGENPAVRAADRLAVERRGAWVAAWRAAVGDDAPLRDPRLVQLLQRDETELWLGTDTEPGEGPETLVVANPYTELSDERARELHRRLLELPRGHRVIVVLEPDPDAPSGAQVPGIGWVPAIVGS